jgi:Na+-translocating ferredoxin:NAD+ oxidoreductase subunit G
MKKFYPIIILTVIMLCSVVLLSLTNEFTKDKIIAQQNEQTLSQLRGMFSDMTDYTLTNDIYIINKDSQKIGYAFIATGKGYGGAISILVGLENDKTTVRGISILSQSETAGLGARITKPVFTDRFIGKNINDIKLTQDGGQIDGISGSTISSRAVVEAVRTTALQKVQELPN